MQPAVRSLHVAPLPAIGLSRIALLYYLSFPRKPKITANRPSVKHGTNTHQPAIVKPTALMTLPMNIEPKNMPVLWLHASAAVAPEIK